MPLPTIASPLRVLGAFRIVAGGWLVAAGIETFSQRNDLLPLAARLFNGNPGTTDAPIRSLLQLLTAPVLIAIGVTLVVNGFRWLPRLRLPEGGPAALARDEVIATVLRHEAPAFGAGPVLPYWPLRRWLSDALDDLPWWRRDLMGRGIRAFVRACELSAMLGVLFLGARLISTNDLLGLFPASFVVLLLFVTSVWAVLGLMLITSHGPRIESITFPLPMHNDGDAVREAATVIESRPLLLDRDSPALGLMLGIAGLGVQCVIAPWWRLSLIGYPHMATSIARHVGSLAGGIVFFWLGGRMVTAAAEILLSFRFESTVVCVAADAGQAPVAHAAAVRTESRGLNGPRHIVVAVGGARAREDAEGLLAKV